MVGIGGVVGEVGLPAMVLTSKDNLRTCYLCRLENQSIALAMIQLVSTQLLCGLELLPGERLPADGQRLDLRRSDRDTCDQALFD